MVLNVSARYLWLPVSKAAPPVKLRFSCAGRLFQEMDLRLAPQYCTDYYAPMDLGDYRGREIEITSALPDAALSVLSFQDAPPPTVCPFRPLLHCTADTGWINDPNGLVYADGLWHLYHQWNPYGTEWGNMHWGHAVSRDLITWRWQGPAMAPDEYGTVYSGCCWPDRENAAGFGPDALLFFYTAAGGRNQWSADAGNPFTQRLAVSADSGASLRKEGLILPHIRGENRDPKVFHHPQSDAYIMVLYLDGNEFALFRSRDLLRWEESQRFSAPDMWECPDLFELPVDNEPGVRKWVFWSADGYYLVGRFDGFRFTPESDVLSAYDTRLPYAAQTFAGAGDRVISVAWLRTESDRGHFRGMMSLPAELTLLRQESGYRVRLRPVRALWDHFTLSRSFSPSPSPLRLPLAGRPVLLEAAWEPGREKTVLAGGQRIPVSAAGGEPVLFLLDHGILEYWGEDGLVWGAVETDASGLSGSLELSPGTAGVRLYDYTD